MFQFTHPGGVRQCSTGNRSCDWCFNSRTREGCDSTSCAILSSKSTVSIHAPGRGATRLLLLGAMIFKSFNSRTREGCDGGCVLVRGRAQTVSIHAPGRGATRKVSKKFPHMQVSIHAPGRGATAPRGFSPGANLFQFTHPGGVRQYGAKLRIMGRINKRNLRLEVLL